MIEEVKIPYGGKLAIFTSFYNHMAYAPYIRCLATTLGVLNELGIKHEYLMRASDFHIERAINNTLTEIMERGDVTDVLLIDSDESWYAQDVVRLLLHPEDIVAASYRMKNKWDEYTGVVRYTDGAPDGKMVNGLPLLRADRVAAGFLRIKVSALRRFHDAYPDLRSTESDGVKTQFFTRIIRDGEMHCQDMAFSRLWLDIGGELWIDPNVNIGHWGFECHEGDLNAHIKAQYAPKPFEIIKQMAAEIEARAAA